MVLPNQYINAGYSVAQDEIMELEAENKKLKTENRHMNESLCTMPKCKNIDQYIAENKRLREALEKIRYCIKTGELGISEIELTVDEALQTKEGE